MDRIRSRPQTIDNQRRPLAAQAPRPQTAPSLYRGLIGMPRQPTRLGWTQAGRLPHLRDQATAKSHGPLNNLATEATLNRPAHGARARLALLRIPITLPGQPSPVQP